MEERRVVAERGEAAAVDRLGAQIGLGVGAVDGAATPPEAAMGGSERKAHASMGASRSESAPEDGETDEIEQVVVLAGARVGPPRRHGEFTADIPAMEVKLWCNEIVPMDPCSHGKPTNGQNSPGVVECQPGAPPRE